MIRYAPSTSAVARSRRELDSAASGSTHSTYHGSTQLSVTSSATLAQPRRASRSAAPAPRRDEAAGDQQHAATDASSQRQDCAALRSRRPRRAPGRSGWACSRSSRAGSGC